VAGNSDPNSCTTADVLTTAVLPVADLARRFPLVP
jgi:hypothetical protein